MTCIAICVSLRKKWGVECLNIVSEHARSFQHIMVVKLLNSVALPSAHSSLVGSGFRLFSFFYLLVCFVLFILFFYRCSCPCLLSALTAVDDDDGGSSGVRMATTLTKKQQRVAVVTQTSNGWSAYLYPFINVDEETFQILRDLFDFLIRKLKKNRRERERMKEKGALSSL